MALYIEDDKMTFFRNITGANKQYSLKKSFYCPILKQQQKPLSLLQETKVESSTLKIIMFKKFYEIHKLNFIAVKYMAPDNVNAYRVESFSTSTCYC